MYFYQIDKLSVVDVIGSESDKILHNLTTNHVRALEVSTGLETFITDVRGKTIGHVLAFRNALGFRLIGAPGQSQRIVEHCDRYTIREDSSPSVQDDTWCGFVVPQCERFQGADREASQLHHWSIELAGQAESVYDTPWLDEPSSLILVRRQRANEVARALQELGLHSSDEAAFHVQRTLAAVPWFGTDMDESNLPQEADRDRQTICFTKGCYLGQETVARLDALGQVQKKLVLWEITGRVPKPGETLTFGDKAVARLTSIAVDDRGLCRAIAMTRRSHFSSSSQAQGDGFVGSVVKSGRSE